jgi:UDP-glucose:glycoprotein glucosyltransferase
LLDLLTSPEVFSESLASLASEAIHEASVRTLSENGYLSEPGALDSFELSLALHAASPKLEAFYQYYQDHKLAQTPLIDGELLDDCSGSWVDWYGHRVCSVDTLRHLVEVKTLEAANDTMAFVCVDILTTRRRARWLNFLILRCSLMNQSKLLSFDHVHPPESGSLRSPSKTAILYGSVASPNFRSLHDYLFSLSRENPPRLQYVYRHIPPEGGGMVPNYLSGYGVTLDLKKMDYLALDDRKHSRSSE